MRADHAGNVSLIDDQVGQILDVVEQRGELDNTVIVFSSDHGEMNGDHGLIYQMNFFDGSVRVPLIVRTPDTVGSELAGTVSTAPTELIDIGPTLAEAAGADLGHRHYANSLLSVLDGSLHRPDAISEFEGDVMLLNDEWKIVVNKRGEPYLLFNRADDPDEVENLVLDPATADLQAELSQRILALILGSQVYQRGEVNWSDDGRAPAARPH
jgi:choline-sulfatase